MDSEEYKRSLRAEALRKNLEINILKIIEEKLTKGEMDVSRAQAIARMVLQKLLCDPNYQDEKPAISPTLKGLSQALAAGWVVYDHGPNSTNPEQPL